MSAASATAAPGHKQSRGRRWLFPGFLAALLIFLVVVSVRTTPSVDQQPYELESTGPFGLRALRDSLREMGYEVRDLRGDTLALPEEGDLLLSWPGVQEWSADELGALRALRDALREMGYEVRNLRGDTLALPEEGDLLLSWPGVQEWSADELGALRTWVGSGRTAMLLASEYDTQYPLEPFGVDGYYSGSNPFEVVNQVQPGLPELGEEIAGASGTVFYDINGRALQLTQLDESEWRASLAVEQIGMGWLWYLTDAHALTNANLREDDQTAVLAAILRDVPDGGIVYFDAFHLYGSEATQEEEASRLHTLQQWLYFTPLGQATLLALVVGVIGWVMAGRRLGPPLKSARELKRREGAEYIRAIAGLKRRAHARDDIIQRQAQRLKLALGRPRHIPATLEDSQFLDQLRHSGDIASSRVDEATALLARIRGAASEDELVKSAAAIDAFLASQ